VQDLVSMAAAATERCRFWNRQLQIYVESFAILKVVVNSLQLQYVVILCNEDLQYK